MKVYVITKGCYSDYHICAVETDKEKAKLLAQRFSSSYEKAEIEEWDTDANPDIYESKYCYSCFYHEKDKKISVLRGESFDYYDGIPSIAPYGCFVKVAANDDETAMKKASDIFAKFRAERMDL